MALYFLLLAFVVISVINQSSVSFIRLLILLASLAGALAFVAFRSAKRVKV
jgi:hypothetical protein